MTAPGRATTYDDCDDDDDDDDDYSDDDVVLSLFGGRPAAGRSLDSEEDRFLPVVDCGSYQKRKFKKFMLSIHGLWSSLLRTDLSSEGLAALPRSLTFPLQVTSEFWIIINESRRFFYPDQLLGNFKPRP